MPRSFAAHYSLRRWHAERAASVRSNARDQGSFLKRPRRHSVAARQRSIKRVSPPSNSKLPWRRCGAMRPWHDVLRGQGVRQDYAQAATWYRKAAEQGNAEAQFMLGLCTTWAMVCADYAQAATWYRRPPKQGNAEAQFMLGALYDMGPWCAPGLRASGVFGSQGCRPAQ